MLGALKLLIFYMMYLSSLCSLFYLYPFDPLPPPPFLSTHSRAHPGRSS